MVFYDMVITMVGQEAVFIENPTEKKLFDGFVFFEFCLMLLWLVVRVLA
jgi:hypothetical protein